MERWWVLVSGRLAARMERQSAAGAAVVAGGSVGRRPLSCSRQRLRRIVRVGPRRLPVFPVPISVFRMASLLAKMPSLKYSPALARGCC
jgi:hypothetical protein